MKILPTSLTAVCLFAAAPSGAAVSVQTNPDYSLCVVRNTRPCYPVGPGGQLYIPRPDTPAGIAFEQCLAGVRAHCASLYPG